jgi:DNA-binding MarR family transcriptional regulator
MTKIENKSLFELEILRHVESTPLLSNRAAAEKLNCSVKLAHELLKKMVAKGFLNVRKLHARRWDYFLTPRGIAEKARLTKEFLEFSFHFYHEARKKSSQVCRDIAESGGKTVAFLGAGELAEICYLGVREFNLSLTEVFDDGRTCFLGAPARPLPEINSSEADAIIVCVYDRTHPMTGNYLPDNVAAGKKMRWIF